MRQAALPTLAWMRPAEPQGLATLLQARSVAIVGISQPGRFGGQVYANLRNMGYPGLVFGVNPNYAELYDQPCYPSLLALPEVPECAVLGVSNARLPRALQEAAELGVPSAVIFASAYSDDGSLQAQLADLARAHHMHVCGPNGMGLISFGQRLALSGYPVLPAAPDGHITLISHSGSVFDALVQNNRGVRFNYAISPGNELVTTAADYMRFALDDPATRVIALFLEVVRDPQGFMLALRQAAERDIPVVALKVGRSEQGARLVQAHSGALAGDDAVFDAVLAYHGVRRVRSLDEMMDTLELFALGCRAPTRHIAALFDSGGERSLFADLAEVEEVTFAPIGEPTRRKLAAVLEPGLTPVNPLDAWGTGHDFDRVYAEGLQALDADPETGLTLFVVDLTRAGNLGPSYADVALAVQPQLTKPLAFIGNASAAISEDEAGLLRADGIPVLMGSETALRAVKHLLEYSRYQRERTLQTADRQSPVALLGAGRPLDELDDRQRLQACGIATPPEAAVNSLVEALSAAEAIGYPVALKTAAGYAHKSEIDGVRLDLRNAAELTVAYRDLEARLGPRVLVQQMITGGVELLLGIVNHASFGMFLAIGLGGVFVEALWDRRLLMLPTTPAIVKEALLDLRGAALFGGLRGRPPVDIDAVVEAALRLSALALDLGNQVAAIDVNPLIARPAGAIAVDVLIVWNPQP